MSPVTDIDTSLENIVHCENESAEPTRVILVPLDATEVTGKVLKWIIEWVDPKKDLVVLFSAYRSAARDLPIGMGFDFQGAIHKLNQDYSKSAEKWLVESCKELNSHGIRCKGIIQQGDPRHLIEEQIVKNRADLVIMGKSKRGKVARFLGSVCNTILHVSPVPVLLIP